LILLIFASCVTGITGMSYLTPFHQDKCLSVFMFFYRQMSVAVNNQAFSNDWLGTDSVYEKVAPMTVKT
jgi:hypothetical protein